VFNIQHKESLVLYNDFQASVIHKLSGDRGFAPDPIEKLIVFSLTSHWPPLVGSPWALPQTKGVVYSTPIGR